MPEVEVVSSVSAVGVEDRQFIVEVLPTSDLIVETTSETTNVSIIETNVVVEILEEPSPQVVIEEAEVPVLSVAEQGPPGASNVFISSVAPISLVDKYFWIQTGLGESGSDLTLWVEDGA